MRTVIYLDVLLLVNFVVGAAFLLAAGLLCGACCSPLRLVGGAGTAAVSSLVLLAPTAPWPLALTYKCTTAALCVAAAYGWQGVRNTVRLTAWFILLNLTLTGALLLPGAACNNLSFYLPVSPGLLLASTVGVCGGVQGGMHLLGRSGGAERGAESPLRHRFPCTGAAFGPGRGAGAAGGGASARGAANLSGTLPRGRRGRAEAGMGRAVRALPDRRGPLSAARPARCAFLRRQGAGGHLCGLLRYAAPAGRLDGPRQRRDRVAVGEMRIRWEEICLCFNDL